jgi:hypothetical protein
MPTVRKLDDDEVRGIERKTLGQRKAAEVEYDRLLADFGPGDYGEVQLDAGEKRLTVRNRLKAAAARREPSLALDFRRTRGEMIRLSVGAAVSGAGAANEAIPSSAPPAASVASQPEPAEAPKRRGRPPGVKNAAPPSPPPATTTSGRRRKSPA